MSKEQQIVTKKKTQNIGWTHMSNIYVHYLRNKKTRNEHLFLYESFR